MIEDEEQQQEGTANDGSGSSIDTISSFEHQPTCSSSGSSFVYGPQIRVLFQYLERVDPQTLEMARKVPRDC